MRRILVLLALASAVYAPGAAASQVISTSSVTGLELGVNRNGEALLTYTSKGKVVHVLAWGAINAIPPTSGVEQVALKLDYSGGFDKYYNQDPSVQKLRIEFSKIRYTPGYLTSPVTKQLQHASQSASEYWKTGGFSCGKYDGPTLAWLVTACKAPDGTYWAVQSWQRLLPDYGVEPTPVQSAWEVHLAHWKGRLPELTIQTDWAWHQWDHLFGTYTYDGSPVFGFKSTSVGAPLDSFGRNLYVDTFDSKYGSGWIRENSFLTHTNTGVFCYSFNPHAAHPAGNGTKYRATILGPGVTPDVMWEGTPPGAYDKDADAAANQQITDLQDNQCRPN
ncbi:MAG TPA: hypothetical protein VGH35_08575 [Gaiellaceae bacterium]